MTIKYDGEDDGFVGKRQPIAMAQQQDIVERLLNLASPDAEYLPDGARLTAFVKAAEEAAQTIAALRAERDTSARGWRKAFDDMHQRAMAAEAKVKELEAEISNLDAELDHWSQLAVDDLGKNPPTSWKEIADTAIRERDELRLQAIVDFGQIQTALEERDDARKALEAVNATAALNRDFNRYMIEPHALEMVEAVLDRASSNREGGEE